MMLLTVLFIAALILIAVVVSDQSRSKNAKSSFDRAAAMELEPVTITHPRSYRAQHEYVPDAPTVNAPISPLSVFHSKPPLTKREATCYWSLANHLNGHYIVLPQVAFSAFLRVEGGDSKSNYRRFATMRQKVADFLIVRPDFSIVALIELDDSTHVNKKEADQLRDAAIKQAGIRVFRIPKVPHADQVQRLCDVLLKLDQLKQA
jgi:very-short-patch-repair endonuclease